MKYSAAFIAMLVLAPVVVFLLVIAFKSLFFATRPPPDSLQAIRTSNLSQELIDELLANWVTESIQTYNKSSPSDETINIIQTDFDDKSKFSKTKVITTTITTTKNPKFALNKEVVPLQDLPLADAPHTPMNPSGSLFAVPPVRIIPDWDVVLGSFDHYDDDNWENFLIQSEVPLFIRRLLGWASETLTIEKQVIREPGEDLDDFQLLISTVNWLISHESHFYLRNPYIEDDLDGTKSENTFYFLTPRTLVQNKLKEQWHMYLFRQFDERGCNMTVVDRNRKLAARRYYKRAHDLNK